MSRLKSIILIVGLVCVEPRRFLLCGVCWGSGVFGLNAK